MNRVRRTLVPMLIAAVVVPTAAAAQEPSRPVDATPATEARALCEVRLTFHDPRSANPWAVFGRGLEMADDRQPRDRVGDAPANGPVAGRPRLANIEATALAKSRPAAKRGMADQGQSWEDWWASKPGLLLIAIVAGVIVLVATGHSDEIPWLSGR
jgi:hypothetical protein